VERQWLEQLCASCWQLGVRNFCLHSELGAPSGNLASLQPSPPTAGPAWQ
jgi:hypothetical protein